MYLSFYNFREFPFSMGCDQRYYFESNVHSEALANMLYTFQQRKGMVMISGEVGAGKTFVGNLLINRLGPGCQAVLLRHPPQTGKQMMRALSLGLGLKVSNSADKFDMIDQLYQHLLRMYHRGRLVALIIDESQDLSPKALEEIRLLWNWEQDGQRLLQILLIGQPEIREKLLEPRWESLRQRIVLSYHLGHLSPEDTARYIGHRLKVASLGGPQRADFTPQAIAEVFSASDGIPRLINVLCDNALLVGYAKNTHCIDRSIVSEVLRDMTCWGLQSSQAASNEYENASQNYCATGV